MNNLTAKTFAQKYKDIMPPGAGALFFIQLFSTIAFSVLYSTLVLYATDKLKLSDTVATGITASFVAFNYALHLLGGFLGGRFLTYRALFAIGMVAIIVGCVLIAIPDIHCLYWGLAAFLTGCGLNVTCINCMLTQLFKPSDKRREAAFLWNYSGMNMGFFIGFSVSGYYQLTHSYHELFIFSSLGSLIALVLTVIKWNSLNDRSTHFSTLSLTDKRRANWKGISLIIALMFGLRVVLENSALSNDLIMIVGAAMGGVIIYFASTQPEAEERKKLWAFFILAITALVFWTLYQLAPMGLMLFIERNVDRHYLGMQIAPQWAQNINTFVIIFGAPLLSMIFSSLRTRGIAITIPTQFCVALLLIGLAFVILPIGIHFADGRGLSSFNWIIASFVLQSLGELFISPIGYAMVGQLAPNHLQGPLMGIWMMVTGVAATVSGYCSDLALSGSQSTDPLVTNPSFSHMFNLVGWISIVTGVALAVVIPLILRLTQEKNLIARTQTMSTATV